MVWPGVVGEFFAEAADDEHRVVDTDAEAHHGGHGHGQRIERGHSSEGEQHSDRGQHPGDGHCDRDRRCGQGAEGEDEQDQRDRDADCLGAGQVGVLQFGGRVLYRRVPGDPYVDGIVAGGGDGVLQVARDFRAFGHVAVHAGERDRDVTVGRDLGSGQPVVGADDVDHALDRGGGGDRASHRCTELGVGGGDRARLQHDDRLFRTELREVPGNQAIHLGGLRALDTEIHRTEPVLEQRVGHRAHHQQQSPDRQDRTSAPGHQNAPPI